MSEVKQLYQDKVNGFIYNDIDELDGYKSLLDLGVTPEKLEEAGMKNEAECFRLFMQQHGLD